MLGPESGYHYSVTDWCPSWSDLDASFVMAIATQLLWLSSWIQEYMMFSRVYVVILLDPVHLHSIIPRISRRYLLISFMTCAVFPVAYMVQTFHVPTLLVILGLTSVSLACELPLGFYSPASSYVTSLLSWAKVCFFLLYFDFRFLLSASFSEVKGLALLLNLGTSRLMFSFRV